MNRHVSTSVNGQGAELVVIAEGREYTAETWSLDYETDFIDVYSFGDLNKIQAPGRARVTLHMTGVRGSIMPVPGSPAREDTVTHAVAICCCPSCPGDCQ